MASFVLVSNQFLRWIHEFLNDTDKMRGSHFKIKPSYYNHLEVIITRYDTILRACAFLIKGAIILN